LTRGQLLHLLGNAPPQLSSFTADTLELTLATLEQTMGFNRAAVVQLVWSAPQVLLAPNEPVATLRRLTQLLRLPQSMVAANLRTRLQILALTERQLRERCAAIARILVCEGSSCSSGAADAEQDEAAFATFAARSPGQALALLGHSQDAVAERLVMCCEALDGAPVEAVAAVARARPLVLELSGVVLRSRAMVLAEGAYAADEEEADGSCSSRSSGGDDASSRGEESSAARPPSSGEGSGSQEEGTRQQQQQQQQLAQVRQRRKPLRDLLAVLSPEELEGLGDRMLLAPHSLHLWLQQLRTLLSPPRPPLDTVRLLLRLRVRPQEVLVRWQALQLATRGSADWLAQLEGAPIEDLAVLLSANHEQLARLRYLSATDRRGEATLMHAVGAGGEAFAQEFPGFMEWIRCGG